MSIFIPGMPCQICGEPILATDSLRQFPPFEWNEVDPLFRFSDANVHESCLRASPCASELDARMKELGSVTPAASQRCRVCDQHIIDPDEFETFGRLTGDSTERVFAHNYAAFHRACLSSWEHLSQVVEFVEEGLKSGRIRGKAAEGLLRRLKN